MADVRRMGKAVALTLEQHPGEKMLCTTFAARALVKRYGVENEHAYREAVPSEPMEPDEWWARSCSWPEAPDPKWGCIAAWLELGGTEIDPNDQPPGSWMVWQAWGNYPKGHQGFTRRHPWAGLGGVGSLVVDSDSFYGMRDRAVTFEYRMRELGQVYGGTWTARAVLL